MESGETEAFATRLTSEEAERVREVLDQTELTKSDLLARGFRYYMDENPDNIPAFRPEDPDLGYLEKVGILAPEHESEWTGINDR